jgi:hypothetical protein
MHGLFCSAAASNNTVRVEDLWQTDMLRHGSVCPGGALNRLTDSVKALQWHFTDICIQTVDEYLDMY